METGPAGDDPAFARQVLEQLPAAVFVMDEVGTIRFASERAAELVDRAADDLVGVSVLDFIGSDTSWAYAAAVAMATDYAGMVMGPLRVTFIGPDGEARRADLWATNHLDDPTIRGIVCLITAETTAMGLGEAVAALAGHDDSLATIASRVVTALRGHPVVADAVIYHQVDGQLQVLASFADPGGLLIDPNGPLGSLCEPTMAKGARRLRADLADVPADLREAAEHAGYQALWMEPVDPGPDGARAVMALWRTHHGAPSPNELNSVYQAASILALALTLEGPR